MAVQAAGAQPRAQVLAAVLAFSEAGGGDGFADVWKRDFFAWECKGHRKDLRAAYIQLMGYKDDLGNKVVTLWPDRVQIRP